jgi:hypothetical protein
MSVLYGGAATFLRNGSGLALASLCSAELSAALDRPSLRPRDATRLTCELNPSKRGRSRRSHQTGWTGGIARIMHVFAASAAEQALEVGEMAVVVEVGPSQAAHGVPDREI